MAFVERRRIDPIDGSCKPLEPIDHETVEIVKEFPPAELTVYCDPIKRQGKIIFGGDPSLLIVAIDQNDGTPVNLVQDFNHGVEFNAGTTVFVGSDDRTDVIEFTYNPTLVNRVIASFQRQVEK